MRMTMKKLKFMLLASLQVKTMKMENLEPIETEEEWDMIEEMLNTFP